MSYRMLFIVLLLLMPSQPSSPPCVLHLEVPRYNSLARQAQIEGTVRVLVKIAPDGKVISAQATSGHQLLRQDVESNIRLWTFGPGVERAIEVFYEFRLKPPATEYNSGETVTLDLPYHVLVTSNFAVPQP